MLKVAIFLFILFIILSSDVFVDRVLATSCSDSVIGRQCTAKGAIIQGVLLSVGYMGIQTLVTNDYI